MLDAEDPEKTGAKRPCRTLEGVGSELPERPGRTSVVHPNRVQGNNVVGPFGSFLAAARFRAKHLEHGGLVLLRELILPEEYDPQAVAAGKLWPLPDMPAPRLALSKLVTASWPASHEFPGMRLLGV